MQKKSLPPRLFYPVLGLFLILVVWIGSRNRPDPIWIETEQLIQTPYLMLDDASDSLRFLLAELHAGEPGFEYEQLTPKSGYDRIAKPYMRSLGWDRLARFCRQTVRQKMIVISGVTGTGATKLAEKAARMLATEPDSNVLFIRCAPEFDLEYHKKYIGYENENGRYEQGDLLKMWDQCFRFPRQRFVCIVDNFDKINPETFFGPELWEMLSTPREKALLGGRDIQVPPNFYMISVTHLGPGSRIEFNEEHYKRIGAQYVLRPNAAEWLQNMRQQARDLAPKAASDPTSAHKMETLLSVSNQRRLIYTFLKTNAIIRNKYGIGYELGQGSNVKKYYLPAQDSELKKTYIHHIGSLGVSEPLTLKSFEPIEYAILNRGLEPGTNFFSRLFQTLRDTGYLVEITMVAATALLTTFIGWWLFRRRERIIRQYGNDAQSIFEEYENQQIGSEEAARRLEDIKKEVNDLVLRRKLNYTEGLYFMTYVDDKVRRIDFARNVSENFLELYNAFMEDNILTENEYAKLKLFLDSIRYKIPEDLYLRFSEKVENAYQSNQKK